MNNLNEMTIGEFTGVFNYLLDNNKKLHNEGKTPVAIGIEGKAGIGKTSLVQEIAEQRGMTLCKLNLSQLEEVGDLVGFPIKEILVTWTDKQGKENHKWFPESSIKTLPKEALVTSHVRMSYAPPSWLPSEENPNGTILLLDDYTRANSLFMQATMELINEGKYISWSLPNNTTVVLTSNPDNGEFQVTSLDSAQKTRMVNFNVKLDINDWALWAEFNRIDSRCINFALNYGDLLFTEHNNIQTINPRAYTTFCKSISGIEDWQDEKSLALILNISKGCFLNDKDNAIGTMFTTFLSQKLDRLVPPKEMLEQKWETVESKIYNCVYDNGMFRPEIASILATRFLNYVLYYFSQKGVKENVVQDRLLDFVNSSKRLFGEDLLFHIIKTLISRYPARTNKLLLNPTIRNKVII